MPAPENTNQLSNVTLFLQNLRKKPKNVILGWHDGGEETPNNYPQGISPSSSQFVGWGWRCSHFGLKDLGHTLTHLLTSEQWDRNPGVESEFDSISCVPDTRETDTWRITSQPAILAYILKPAGGYGVGCLYRVL